MSDCLIETTDEGGDPSCWAHLLEEKALEDERPDATHHLPAAAVPTASGPVSLRATIRS